MPKNALFYFIWLQHEHKVFSSIKTTFPYLNFKVYRFDIIRVRGLISKSICQALDQPINYVKIYLLAILPSHANRLIYLDSTLVMVDDIAKLWEGKFEWKSSYCT